MGFSTSYWADGGSNYPYLKNTMSVINSISSPVESANVQSAVIPLTWTIDSKLESSVKNYLITVEQKAPSDTKFKTIGTYSSR